MHETLEDRTLTLSPDETAGRLGLKPTTLANWRWSGRGPLYVKVGGRVRYTVVGLAEWLDDHTRASTSDPGTHA